MEKKEKIAVVPHFESQCEYCSWYSGDKTCPAFIDGIPENIWKGTHDKVEDNQDLKVIFKRKGYIL